jgi:membrane-associated PAP2 superfamily phosphatase
MPLKHAFKNDWLALCVLLIVIFIWDITDLDVAWEHWYGNAQGFALRNDDLLQYWFHDFAQNILRALFLVCVVMVFYPLGFFKRLAKPERVHLVLATLLALISVLVVKRISQTSCPWSLIEFGGVARYVPYWQWGVPDGGGGHCFPGGHSSSGFAFVAAAFWLRSLSKQLAVLAWLTASATGLMLGWVQQMRGAHFFSHTMWAWLLYYGVGMAYFYSVQWFRARKSPT